MPSIVTITFSPCIDKSASVPKLIPEKKLTCSAVKLEPGGGGINIVRVIKRFGDEATAIFPSGGYTGRFLNHLVTSEKIPCIIIETTAETRENIIITEESTGNQFRFGMPANVLSEDEWKRCLYAVNEMEKIDFLVVSGSLPPGLPGNMFAELKKIVERKKAKLVVDTSGNALKEAVKQGAFLIKPNLAELSALAGLEKMNIGQVETVARDVIQKYNCDMIVVSLGRDGAMLITRSETYRASSPPVRVKSTVGAGDSMVAGIIYRLAHKGSMKEALQYGVACGTAATMNAGTELCHKEDADALYATIFRENNPVRTE